MPTKRTTIELDEALVEQAVAATGGTLRATVEAGLRMVIADSEVDDERRRQSFDRHLAAVATQVDSGVLLSGEAWR